MDESQMYPREIECEDGTCLTIQQSYVGDVGCVVWDAALVLSKYLETKGFGRRFGELKKRRLLEIGAGTGATGLVACKLGYALALALANAIHSTEELRRPRPRRTATSIIS